MPTGPASITLRFSEHVLVDTDAVRVAAESGGRVDTADAHTVGAGDTVVAGLHGGLATGTYLVSWHVISADTHPVSGGFNFGVGMTPATYRAAGGGVSGLDVVGAAGRTLVYAGLVLAVGVGAFLAAVWPAVATQAAVGQLLLPDRQLGPFTVRMRPTGQTGGFSGRAAVTATGQWQLRFTIQVDELTAYVTTSFYPVR